MVCGGFAWLRRTRLFLLWPYIQAFIVPVHAAEGDGSALSPDTIVTEDNIDEVIKYLGLDPNDFIKTNTSSDNENSPAITVGESEKVVNQLKQLPNEIEVNDNSSSNLKKEIMCQQQNAELNNNVSSICTGTTMLYYTTNLGGSFELFHEVAAAYSWNYFTAVNYAGVDVLDVDGLPVTSFSNGKQKPKCSSY